MRRTRKTRRRTPKKLIVIVCEGAKSEISYFYGLFQSKSDITDRYSLNIYRSKDHSPLGIVNSCIEEEKAAAADKIPKSDIYIWAVFDRDDHSDLPDAFNKANSKNIKIAFSSVCFEFWLLLHYEKTTSPFQDCTELIRRLKKHNAEYDKADNLYEKLDDKIDTAIKNGEWVIEQVQNANPRRNLWDLNPYTNCGYLASFLLELDNS